MIFSSCEHETVGLKKGTTIAAEKWLNMALMLTNSHCMSDSTLRISAIEIYRSENVKIFRAVKTEIQISYKISFNIACPLSFVNNIAKKDM